MTLEILAPAKINLFLEAGHPKRGYHPIVSLIDIISLYDAIKIKEAEKTSVVFSPQWNIPAENTVSKTVSLFQEAFKIRTNFKVEIQKQIPPGSGLGGGSSNAAFVLKILLKHCEIPADKNRLLRIAAQIGKDVPIFIDAQRCTAEGFGERIANVPFEKRLSYLLFIPEFGVSTGKVYSNLDTMQLKGNLTEGREKIKIILAFIKDLDISSIEKNIENRLEKSYLNLYPQAKEVKDYLEDKIAKKFFVSGSGGALFGIFATEKEAKEKSANIKLKGWKSYVVSSV